MARMFLEGGPFMYLVLLAVPVALFVPVVLGAATAFRWRVPAVLWLAPLFLVWGLGALGTSFGWGRAVDAVGYASTEMQPVLAAAGHAFGAIPWMFAAGSTAFAAAVTGGIAALTAAIGAGERARLRIGAPLAAGLLGLIGAVAVGASLLVWREANLIGVAVGALWVLGAGVAIGLTALRANDEPADEARNAGARLLVLSCAVVGGVALASLFSWASLARALEAASFASPDMRMTLVAYGLHEAHVTGRILQIAVAACAVASLPVLLPALGRIDRRAFLGGVATLLLVMLPFLGTRGWMNARGATLVEVAGLSSTVGDYFGTADLPAAGDTSPPAGTCLVRREQGGWRGQWRYGRLGPPTGACPESTGPLRLPLADDEVPLVGVPKQTPATELVSSPWFEERGRIEILAHVDRGLDDVIPALVPYTYASTAFTWRQGVGPEEALGGILVIGGAETQVAAMGQPLPLADTPQATLSGAPQVPLYLVPGRSWTVGDLLDWCAARPQDHGSDASECILLSRNPLVE